MKLFSALAAVSTILSTAPANPSGGAAVTGVSVIPTVGAVTGRAEVVIAVDSTADVHDFKLSNPARIVIDMSGAKLAVRAHEYDHMVRGGVAHVRYSQFRAGVVRLVIELDAKRKYTVTRDAGDIRVDIDGDSAPTFAAWHSGHASDVQLAQQPAAVMPVAETAPVAKAPAAPAPVAQVAAVATPVATTPAATPAVSGPAATAPATPVETVDAPAPAPARVRRRAAETPEPVQQVHQSTQPRITTSYQDADIREVLAAFATFSGRTIVAGSDVKGTVTADIHDQPWDVALRLILDAQQMEYSEDASGNITVDSYKNFLAKQSSEPLETQMVTVNYANAASLAPTVKTLLARDCGPNGGQGAGGASAGGTTSTCPTRGNVVADTATNTLVITEPQSHIKEVVDYIRRLDVKTPQVSIRAKIIFINRTEFTQLGLAYDLGAPTQFYNQLVQRTNPLTGQPYDQSVNVVDLGGNTLAGISNAARPYSENAALNLLYSLAIGKFSLTSFLDATQGLQLSDVQAEPSVVTLDNRVANIQVGEETPIRVIDANSGSNGPAQATVTFKETGIILNVTPHITLNGQVLMTVHAEQSQLQNVGGDLGYNFFKRAADTKLLVNNGETAVIGGLTETQVSKTRNAIPILGELPLIGNLFSQTNNQKIKQDLLILITPHVLQEGEVVDSSIAKQVDNK